MPNRKGGGRAKGSGSTYTHDKAWEVCRLMREELLTARGACRKLKIPIGTLYHWLDDHKDFAEHYARAREALADGWVDEMREIAADCSRDVLQDEIVTEANEGKALSRKTVQKSDNTAVNRDRLRIDTTKWTVSRLFPAKYGDKLATEVSGPNGGPIQYQDAVDRPPKETHEEWKSRIERQMAALRSKKE